MGLVLRRAPPPTRDEYAAMITAALRHQLSLRHHEHHRCRRRRRSCWRCTGNWTPRSGCRARQRDGAGDDRRRRSRAAADGATRHRSAADRYGEVLRRWRPERRDRRAERPVSSRRHARCAAGDRATSSTTRARSARRRLAHRDARDRRRGHRSGAARLRAARGRGPVRHRIEHFGLPTDEQLARAARLGVIAAPQTIFVHELGRNFRRYLPDALLAHVYPVRGMLDAGLTVALSSDAPVVEDDSPLTGMQAAILRRDADGAPIAPARPSRSTKRSTPTRGAGRSPAAQTTRSGRSGRACVRTSRSCRPTSGRRRPRT